MKYLPNGAASVLIGAGKASQIEENIGALNNTGFTKGELGIINDTLNYSE